MSKKGIVSNIRKWLTAKNILFVLFFAIFISAAYVYVRSLLDVLITDIINR